MEGVEEQIDKFICEIENKINYYLDEFEVPQHALLGALEYVKISFARHMEENPPLIFDPEEEDNEQQEDT